MSVLNGVDVRRPATAGFMAALAFLAGCSRAPVPLMAPAASSTPATLSPAPGTETPTLIPPSPTATAFPLNTLSDLAFVDPLHGWVLGAACDSQGDCPLGVRKSVDGGKTWTAAAAPQASLGIGGPGLPGVRHLAFGSLQDGWAYDTSLFSTHDGGETWAITAMPGDVIALQVAGDSVWAIAQVCQSSGSCTLQLLSSPIDGGGWAPLPAQPPVAGDQAILVHGESGAAWVLSWSAMAPTSGQLAATHDGGATWQVLTDPTTARMCTVKLLAASDVSHLWLLCGGEGATIMMEKALFGSTDGGAHWSLIADATPPGDGGKNNLSLSGHVADLAVAGTDQVFIGLDRSTLITSSDGGLTWKASIPLDPQMAGDVGVDRVVFADADHGWALSGPTTMYRTEDAGVHWQAIPIE